MVAKKQVVFWEQMCCHMPVKQLLPVLYFLLSLVAKKQ